MPGAPVQDNTRRVEIPSPMRRCKKAGVSGGRARGDADEWRDQTRSSVRRSDLTCGREEKRSPWSACTPLTPRCFRRLCVRGERRAQATHAPLASPFSLLIVFTGLHQQSAATCQTLGGGGGSCVSWTSVSPVPPAFTSGKAGDQTDPNDEFKSVMALKGWRRLSARQVKDQTNLSFSTKKKMRTSGICFDHPDPSL